MPLRATRWTRCGPRSSSTSRTSRCSARASGSALGEPGFGTGPRVRGGGLPLPAARIPAGPSAPSLAVIGTGKRIGKTAVTGHLARLLSQRGEVVVVSMGRGGPARARARAGRADAGSAPRASPARAGTLPPTTWRRPRSRGCPRSAAGVPAAGSRATCSRPTCGSGSSSPRSSAPDVVVFDGSGAAIPPVSVDGRVLVVGPGQDATAYLNPYRVLVSDLVLLMGGGEAAPIRELKDVPVIPVELRLRPPRPARREAGRSLHGGPRAGRPPRRRGGARLAEPRRPCRAA